MLVLLDDVQIKCSLTEGSFMMMSLCWRVSVQIDRDEVSIRRVIGAKKDSYYMDKKHVT